MMKKLLYTFIVAAFFSAAAMAQTTILSQDFENGFGEWTTVSVIGDQVWELDSIHGNPGTCAKMSGYAAGAYDNEDWLISPAINLNNYDDEVFTFETAMNYTGPDLELFYSTDYAGDPTTATWESLSFTASTGGWEWTPSGNIDLSTINGENVYIAFKFTSTTSGSATWEVDNLLLVSGNTPPPSGDVIFENDFENGFLDWTSVSVIGDQVWELDSQHGNPGTCAKMSGYDGGAYDNEDWLISPAFNADDYENEVFTFETAMNYTGPDLELFYSTDYAGDPTTATWESLSFTASTGGWEWTPSGNIDLSTINGENVYIAFKFTSTTNGSATWEVDNIKLEGSTAGIKDQNRIHFSIYPNPNNGSFSIQNETNDETEILIYNILGSKIYAGNTNTKLSNINLDLTPGTYFIQLKNMKSNLVTSQKFIVR
jgi:hypothetical protein